jgi:glycosyltransferase involved in cell wall biosynthesis
VTTASVSIIATVKDEIESIRAWMDGIERQTRLPDEVIIVDGGSSDGTWEALASWSPGFPVSVVRLPGSTIAEGRNAAIASSGCALVAVTDAGTVAAADWLAHIVTPLIEDDVDVISGFFVPVLDSAWSRSLAAATLPDSDELEESAFQPSSRSLAFRRSWWEMGVRYPEWIDYCEDLVWDLALRRAGARFRLVPSAVVEFRVRPSLVQYTQQYYRYARGDGKAGLFVRRHAARYLTYGGLLVVIKRFNTLEIVAAACLGALYVRRPLLRLVRRDRRAGLPVAKTALAIPVTIALRGAGDVAKMAGYPAGLLWRARRFGTVGWKTAWKRITPTGTCFRPATLSRETPLPTMSPAVEFQRDST